VQYFFAVASKIMQQVLVNEAIARRRQKRGGNAVVVLLTRADKLPEQNADVLALDESLAALEKIDTRKARLGELRLLRALLRKK
jgi:hypothetical protein